MKHISLWDLTPITLYLKKPPREMSRKEATKQFGELMNSQPEILDYIRTILSKNSVVLTGDGRRDCELAGEWLVLNSKLAPIPIERRQGLAMWGPDNDIDVATMSACCYIGYLFGDYLIRESPNELRYSLCTWPKKNVYYHMPIIKSADGMNEVEPPSIVMNFIRGRIIHPLLPMRTLADLYDIWTDLLNKVN